MMYRVNRLHEKVIYILRLSEMKEIIEYEAILILSYRCKNSYIQSESRLRDI